MPVIFKRQLLTFFLVALIVFEAYLIISNLSSLSLNDKVATVAFPTRTSFDLTVDGVATTSGSVLFNPPDYLGYLSAGDAYPKTKSYPNGTAVSLIAVPKPGFKFASWLGATIVPGSATSTTNPLELIVNADTQVTAQFTPTTLTVPNLNKSIKLYFQGWGVKKLHHFKSDGTLEVKDTNPYFVEIRDFILSKVDLTQGLNIKSWVNDQYVDNRIDPPDPIINLEYFSTPTLTPTDLGTGPIYAQIERDLALAPAADKNRLENIFLHNASNSSSSSPRLILSRPNNITTYLTNPGSVIRTYLVNRLKTYLAAAANAGVDGIFMDDARVNPFPQVSHLVANNIKISWAAETLETLAYLRSQLPEDKYLIFNTINNSTIPNPGSNFPLVTDGGENEYFIHSYYENLNTVVATSSWKTTIDNLKDISQNRIYLAQSGTSEPMVTLSADALTAMKKMAMFTFGSYLLGKGPYAYYSFAVPLSRADYNAGYNYIFFDYYDLDLGQPVYGEDYFIRGNNTPVQRADLVQDAIYQREFTNALVLVNPSPTVTRVYSFIPNLFNTRVNTDGSYTIFDNQTIPLGVLAPQTAVIFTNTNPATSTPPTSPLNLVSAQSFKDHGGVGELGIDLLTSTESRQGGITRAVLTFNQTLDPSLRVSVARTPTDVLVSKSIRGNQLILTFDYRGRLTGSDGLCYTVTVGDLNRPVYLKNLLGDTNGDGVINNNDLTAIQDNLNQRAGSGNARDDMDLTGQVDISDIVFHRNNSNNVACFAL